MPNNSSTTDSMFPGNVMRIVNQAKWVKRTAWIAIAAATLIVSAYAHVKAGFTLPSPWNDEPWYLWSAISLMQDNTFFSESLNPERVVPLVPVYQVPLALLFKVTGFSFALARWVSWGYMGLAYVGVLLLVKPRPLPLLSAGVASLFFLGASAIVAGNMCRPEAIVWAIAVWSFVLADRGHWWNALSLAGIGAWAHQIGMVFFAGMLFLFLQWSLREKGRLRPGRWDWLVMGLALAILTGQLLFIWRYWATYWSDFSAEIGESLQQNIEHRIFFSNKTPWLAIYAGLFGLGLWRPRRLLLPVVIGGCAFVCMLVRPQMWYEIYNQMGFMWLTLTIPWMLYLGAEWLLTIWSRRLPPWISPCLSILAFGLGLLLMLKVTYAHGFVTGPNNYPAKLEWGWGMRMDPSPYITDQDIGAVLHEIEKHVSDGKKYRVFFMPEADALFFYGKMPSNAIPYQGIHTRVLGDMAVFRISRHPPQWWTDQRVMMNLRIRGGEGIEPFYTRDGTEKWILIPPRVDMAPSR